MPTTEVAGAARAGCYVALGDSFSAGGPADGFAPWPQRSAVALGVERFHNLAEAGAPSERVAAEQVARALALEPSLVSLVCGANDVLLSVRPDDRAFGARFGTILERLCAMAALVVTATYPPFAPRGLRVRSRRRIADGLARFNHAVRERSARHGALCLDWSVHERQARLAANLAPDGFHPSDAAHRIAADSFVRGVRAALGADREENQ